jgi:hypothetical protein
MNAVPEQLSNKLAFMGFIPARKGYKGN